MAKCPVVFDQAGYGVKPGSASIAIELEGGAPFVRKTKLGAWSRVRGQFTCEEAEYDALMAWFETDTDAGTLPFTVDVKVGGSALREHDALLVPDTFETVGVDDGIYTVAAEMWVDPEPVSP